jgi:hypothetical protein
MGVRHWVPGCVSPSWMARRHCLRGEQLWAGSWSHHATRGIVRGAYRRENQRERSR